MFRLTLGNTQSKEEEKVPRPAAASVKALFRSGEDTEKKKHQIFVPEKQPFELTLPPPRDPNDTIVKPRSDDEEDDQVIYEEEETDRQKKRPLPDGSGDQRTVEAPDKATLNIAEEEGGLLIRKPNDTESEEKPVRYLSSLIERAKLRNVEREVALEKSLEKEREREEGESLKDKPAYVTAGYKRRLQEREEMLKKYSHRRRQNRKVADDGGGGAPYTPRTARLVSASLPLLTEFGYTGQDIAEIVQVCKHNEREIEQRINDLALEGTEGRGWQQIKGRPARPQGGANGMQPSPARRQRGGGGPPRQPGGGATRGGPNPNRNRGPGAQQPRYQPERDHPQPQPQLPPAADHPQQAKEDDARESVPAVPDQPRQQPPQPSHPQVHEKPKQSGTSWAQRVAGNLQNRQHPEPSKDATAAPSLPPALDPQQPRLPEPEPKPAARQPAKPTWASRVRGDNKQSGPSPPLEARTESPAIAQPPLEEPEAGPAAPVSRAAPVEAPPVVEPAPAQATPDGDEEPAGEPELAAEPQETVETESQHQHAATQESQQYSVYELRSWKDDPAMLPSSSSAAAPTAAPQPHIPPRVEAEHVPMKSSEPPMETGIDTLAHERIPYAQPPPHVAMPTPSPLPMQQPQAVQHGAAPPPYEQPGYRHLPHEAGMMYGMTPGTTSYPQLVQAVPPADLQQMYDSRMTGTHEVPRRQVRQPPTDAYAGYGGADPTSAPYAYAHPAAPIPTRAQYAAHDYYGAAYHQPTAAPPPPQHRLPPQMIPGGRAGARPVDAVREAPSAYPATQPPGVTDYGYYGSAASFDRETANAPPAGYTRSRFTPTYYHHLGNDAPTAYAPPTAGQSGRQFESYGRSEATRASAGNTATGAEHPFNTYGMAPIYMTNAAMNSAAAAAGSRDWYPSADRSSIPPHLAAQTGIPAQASQARQQQPGAERYPARMMYSNTAGPIGGVADRMHQGPAFHQFRY